MKRKTLWLIISALLCGAVSLIGAFDALKDIRPVIIITVLAGAFGSGASLASAIHNLKNQRSSGEVE